VEMYTEEEMENQQDGTATCRKLPNTFNLEVEMNTA
jgi:hypothetical protein